MDRDVIVKGARSDGEGVPLRRGDVGDVEEQPLTRFVFHARFRELDFHRVVRVANHLGDVRGPARGDFAVDALREVDASTPQFPAPPFVADAVVPKRRAGERGEGFLGVAHEAAGCVGVEGEKERDEEVMGVPERFVRLLPDFGMGGGEHQQHTEEHDMSRNATGFRVVYLHRRHGSQFVPFHVEKAVFPSVFGWHGNCKTHLT